MIKILGTLENIIEIPVNSEKKKRLIGSDGSDIDKCFRETRTNFFKKNICFYKDLKIKLICRKIKLMHKNINQLLIKIGFKKIIFCESPI